MSGYQRPCAVCRTRPGSAKISIVAHANYARDNALICSICQRYSSWHSKGRLLFWLLLPTFFVVWLCGGMYQLPALAVLPVLVIIVIAGVLGASHYNSAEGILMMLCTYVLFAAVAIGIWVGNWIGIIAAAAFLAASYGVMTTVGKRATRHLPY